MSNPVFTFSVRESDTETLELIEELKIKCRREGKSFSFVVISALRTVEQQNAIPRNTKSLHRGVPNE